MGLAYGSEAKQPLSKSERVKEWVVVVHADNPVEKLTLTQIRRYLTKETNFWAKKIQVIPIIMESGNSRFNEFTELFFNFSKTQYPRFWIEQKFTRGITKPKEGDVKTALKLIAILKGGITVVPKEDWNQMERPSVKSVEIIMNEK